MGKDEETKESVKLFVTSIKTAEKKPRHGAIEFLVLDVFFHSMLDVRCSMLDVHLMIQAYMA
jgi:hypothetical protein